MILRAGTFLQNRYEIIENIGTGGMSEVYKAKCHKLNRYVAIKVLKNEFGSDENFVKKFIIEAQAAAGLSHPNIVNIYDVVNDNNLHFIVMELVEGITLKSHIAAKGILDIKEAVNIAIQVAKGISAAHDRHIVHRDIKPQNILISVDGTIKVADFGIAKAVSEETVNPLGLGSVHYISPEQAKGAVSDTRSDIYSLGITLYEMISGRVPFNADNPVSIALAHVEEVVAPPSLYNQDISPELETIVLKCMQKNPDRRYQSLTQLINDLHSVLLLKNDTSAEVASETRAIGKEDIVSINSARSMVKDRHPEEIPVRRVTEPKSHSPNKKKVQAQREARDAKSDKMMAIMGALLAVAIVSVVLFFAIKFFASNFFAGSTDDSNIVSTESSTQSSSSIAAKEIDVPDVEGLSEDIAKDRLEDNKLLMKVSESEYSDNVLEGYVISQNPVSKSKLKEGDVVEVVISLGKEKIDLDKLRIVGSNKADAVKLLEEKGLIVTVVDEFSETVEKDKIIRFSAKLLNEGDSVTLYNSKGKESEKAKVPSLVGLSEDEANKAIVMAKLVQGEVKYDYSSSVAKGLVISQSHKVDAELDIGSALGYTLSLGSEPETTTPYKYVASIDTTYNISDLIGPAASTTSVKIMIRLRQTVSGQTVYTTLMEPRQITGDTILPVRFKSIEGADGVEQGVVEVVESNTNSVLKSYTVEFFKVQ